MTLTVKNWTKFQHYKGRRPPWIKLHRDLLDDYEYSCLPLASRALAPCIWLIASESEDGSLPCDMPKLAFRLRVTEKELVDALKPLIEHDFIEDASDMLATRKQNRTPDLDLDSEKISDTEAHAAPLRLNGATGFEDFWKAYPSKKGKQPCLDIWKRKHLAKDLPQILDDLSDRMTRDPAWKNSCVMNPSTYLNQRRWEDAL